ncbi:DUF4364 family protein [Lachnoclostridium sp. Marseille-P6806]|uniref:DUF4364 family protein n=1 Tax=Lachnoclostridium sp. Marseille-P6806 TaxID=2364793 RepID=UPI001031AAAD|nr:DUF4364 family protein [Lachnoclostridium sp. Marseille-P6806]
MTSPITIYKLIVLYMLDRIEGAISNAAISDFLLDHDLTNNYISVQQALFELEQSGLVTSDTMGSRTMIRITREGEEALTFFVSDLNPDIRRECTEFLRANGMQLRSDAETTARYYRRITGDYEVHLAVKEKQTPLVDLRLNVPTEDMAKHMQQGWLTKNQQIYQYLMETLGG